MSLIEGGVRVRSRYIKVHTGLFWGAALFNEEKSLWNGLNWLGELWMELRAELQIQEGCVDDIFGMFSQEQEKP